jgi:hypothetical protein
VDLIGFDIGFSETRRTSGAARLKGSFLSHSRATSEWRSREKVLGSGMAEVIAIDGPILKDVDYPKRLCETVFSSGSFSHRCKPGFSHVPGTGRRFRAAGKEAAERLGNLTRGQTIACAFPRVLEGKNLIEAFPNAFLGVLVSDSCYKEMPRLKRGKKFDWLYGQCCKSHVFRAVIDHVGLGGISSVLAEIEANSDHEERAALVCLLTASAVAVGHYTAVGDDGGGYFFLPPFALWEEWARRELEVQRRRNPRTNICVWINGECFRASDNLPMIA